MTSDNDKKAAEEFLDSLDVTKGLDNTIIYGDDEAIINCFLAGCAHKEKELMPIIESLEKRIIMREEEIVKRLIENKVIRYV